MNKYEEALDKICSNCRTGAIEQGYRGGCAFVDLDNSRCNAYKLLQELVEKATPKKPDFKEVWTPRTLDSLGEPLGFYAFCPNCGEDLSIEIEDLPLDELTKVQNSYCSRCGQAIDWSEEE